MLSNTSTKQSPTANTPKIDITSKHLQIERRRFSEASNKPDQKAIANSLFGPTLKSSSNQKVKQLLDSIQF